MSLPKKSKAILQQIVKSPSGTKIDGRRIVQAFQKAGATVQETKDPKHTWVSVTAGSMATNFSADTSVAIDANIKVMAHVLLNAANNEQVSTEGHFQRSFE